MTDELLQRYRETRSADGFRPLLERHVDAVYSQCLRQLRDPGCAEDATQAVFVLLARKAGSLPMDRPLAGWLFKTCRYVCANARRAAKRREHHEREAAMRRSEPYHEGNLTAELREVLDDALAQLGTADRQVLLLRYYGGQSTAEVAQAIGVSEDAARQRIGRAIVRLRKLMPVTTAVTPAALGSFLERGFVEQAPAHLAERAVSVAVGATPASAAVHELSKGMGSMAILGNAKAMVLTVTALAVLGVAVPVVVSGTNRPAEASAAPVVQVPATAPADKVDGLAITRRLMTALASDDYQTACDCVYSPEPEETNTLKAFFRFDLATGLLKRNWQQRFGANTMPQWLTRHVTISEIGQPLLQLAQDPRMYQATVTGDQAVVRMSPKVIEYIRRMPGGAEAAEMAGTHYYRRVDGVWRYDFERGYRLVVQVFPAEPASPVEKRKLHVKALDAWASAYRRLAETIREGTIEDAVEATELLHQATEEAIAPLGVRSLSSQMMLRK